MSKTSSDTAYDLDEDSYWRSPRTIAAGLVLLAVAGAAIWATATDGDPTTAPPAAAAAQAPPAGDPALPPAEAPRPGGSTYNSACGLSGGSTQIPTDTPAATEWQNLGGSYLPLDKQHGPGKRSEAGPWSCFAQTPTGALLAAYTISFRLGLAEDFESVVKKQTVPGVGQTAMLREGQDPPPADPSVPLGFVVDSYTNDEATVSLYLRQVSAQYTCSFHVQWFGGAKGDWRVRPETNGDDAVCIQGAPSRYVPWGPAA